MRPIKRKWNKSGKEEEEEEAGCCRQAGRQAGRMKGPKCSAAND
jgi:hypothetical protein